MTAIARDLNQRGTPTAKGARWARNSVGVMLGLAAYAGLRSSVDGLVTATWEPIVSEEQWRRVAAQRHAKCRGSPRTSRRGCYLLTVLLYCGLCGRKLYHCPKTGRRAGMYVCPRSSGQGNTGDACKGGAITGARAERLVVGAFLDQHGRGFVLENGALWSVTHAWSSASDADKKRMLTAFIPRIELVPRPHGNARGRGEPRGRQLRIVWETPRRVTSPQ
jgi:Recombinase zinc beta ribbon domain/Recombinase